MDDSTRDTATATVATADGARRAHRTRSDADVARLVFSGVVTIAAFAISILDPASARGFSLDLLTLINRLPPTGARFLVGVIQLGALAAPVALIVVAARTRWRQALLAVAAAAMAAAIAQLGADHVQNSIPQVVIDASEETSWVIGAGFPSGMYLAGLTAAAIVLTRHLDVSWRRVVTTSLVIVLVARTITGVDSIFTLAAMIALGAAVGSAALLIVAFPPRRPRRTDIVDALRASGIEATNVAFLPEVGAEGPRYRADTPRGAMFVKVSGADARDANAFARFTRWLRVKGIADERPFDSRFAIEHEALSLTLAAYAGVSVSEIRAVGTVEATRDTFMAMTWDDGVGLDQLTANELTDEILIGAFEQLARLHEARIAHRGAELAHFRLHEDGSVGCIDFGWAQRPATDHGLALDNAELLTSAATVVGAERAAAAAHQVFGAELAGVLGLLQPLALTSGTRRQAKARPGLLTALRDQVVAVTGTEEYTLEPLRRIGLRTVLTFVATLVIGNLLLGLVANWSEIWAALKDANPAYIPLALGLVATTYFTGALSLMGAVNERLAFGRTSLVMLAQSFLNRFTPANAGGMALRIRYLQRNGVDTVVAGGSVALTSLASGVMQVVFTVVFFAWAGSSAERDSGSFSLPSGSVTLVAIALLLAVAGMVLFTAFGRTMWGRAKGAATTMWQELGPLAREPGKLAMLFGGAFLGKLVPVVILAESVAAFGLQIDFAQLGAMYIVATTVASASPTPGGVGAIEAALTAGLVGLGIDSATAAAIVLYFRFLTYWFPILPSWLGFRVVERTGIA